jgi:hypothetical protein
MDVGRVGGEHNFKPDQRIGEPEKTGKKVPLYTSSPYESSASLKERVTVLEKDPTNGFAQKLLLKKS